MRFDHIVDVKILNMKWLVLKAGWETTVEVIWAKLDYTNSL